MRAMTVLLIAGVVAVPTAGAQQILEIDTAAVRVILDDEWRAIRTIGDMPLDRTRALLYANDDEEPAGATARSVSISTAADRITLHPLRRISGEPCPGMLESVNR